jgi:ribosomal protein S18 acetylase RimI-like enzyme
MIRKAHLSDAKAIQQVENACFISDLLSARSVRYMLRNPQCHTLVYEWDGKIAGYIMTLHHKRNKLARHYSVAVLPECRGRGIAEALLRKAETLCIEKQGCKLEIRTDNTGAFRLYTRLGYSIRRTIPHFYEDNTDAYEMVKYI